MDGQLSAGFALRHIPDGYGGMVAGRDQGPAIAAEEDIAD